MSRFNVFSPTFGASCYRLRLLAANAFRAVAVRRSFQLSTDMVPIFGRRGVLFLVLFLILQLSFLLVQQRAPPQASVSKIDWFSESLLLGRETGYGPAVGAKMRKKQLRPDRNQRPVNVVVESEQLHETHSKSLSTTGVPPLGKSSPDARPYSDKWIVITTIQLPTDAVRTMAAQAGWKVVAVGDQKTPADWQLDNCVFLSVERQAELGYNIHKLIPYKHYGRKNIGYLFAIQHGAKVIYDTDDDNELIVDRLDEVFIINLEESVNDMLVYQPQQTLSNKLKGHLPVVNPYIHFGQKNIWPRGYPLSSIDKAKSMDYKYAEAKESLKPFVQQGLANGDPDVDAVFRLTRKRSGAKIDVTFDREAPPVTLPRGVMSPFNTQNTIIHREAFWGLLVPVTTTFRVCDIWRGYWMQRVLWEVGGTLSFHTASVYQDRNEHNYFLDHVDEFPLYNDSRRFVQFLLDWQPPSKANLFERIRDLGHKMAEEGFWRKEDALLMEAWLSDLQAIGYEPPAIVEKTEDVFGKVVSFTPRSLPSAYLTAGSFRCRNCEPRSKNKSIKHVHWRVFSLCISQHRYYRFHYISPISTGTSYTSQHLANVFKRTHCSSHTMYAQRSASAWHTFLKTLVRVWPI